MVRPLSTSIRTLLVVAVLAAVPLTVLADSFYYIPHLATGLTGSDRFMTRVIITSALAGDVTLNFVRPTGASWSVPVSSDERPDLNGTYSRRTFTMGTSETAAINLIAGQAALTTGWLHISAQQPLTVSAVFTMYRLTGSPFAVTTILGDVGVPPATADTGFRLNFTLGAATPWVGVSTDYGLALANPSGRSAQVILSLYDSGGTFQGETALTLEGFQQTARFLAGLFPEVSFGNQFTGRLEIRSNTPIAPLALKVSNGGLASVPVDRAGNIWVNHMQGEKPEGFAFIPTLNDLPALVTGQVDTGAGGLIDIYRVQLVAGETIVITPVYYAIGSFGELHVRLKNTSGNTITTVSTNSIRDPARIVATAAATGWHTIEVWGVAHNLFKGFTTYHLHVISE